MSHPLVARTRWLFSVILVTLAAPLMGAEGNVAIFNVKDYGATGRKADYAQQAIQKAVDACAKAGGGTVYLPPGEYTSGTIHLRSHVRFYVESGATLFAAQYDAAFDKSTLLYGEDLENISIEGRGTIDGQAEYEWRLNDFNDAYIRDNQLLAEKLGKPLMRSFPKDLHTRKVYPHMVLLLRCKDVRIAGLSFLDSPSWTINPYACERLTIDGVYIHTSLKYGVWADGIVFYSSNEWGPPLPCENITITNCRLSSASSALKFCDGNMNSVRNVTVDNCVITGSNRGIAFMVYDGGYVDNVVLSNLVVNTQRFDWFWWGNGDPLYFTIQRRSESQGLPPKPDEPPAGSIRNVIVRNVIAHGKGSCLILGHPQSWLQNISLENIKLFLSTDPEAAYDRTVNAMQFRFARDLKVRDLQVTWEKPELNQWQSALSFQDVQGLNLDGFVGGPAKLQTDIPAVVFERVEDASIRNSTARPGTQVFLKVKGPQNRHVYLINNELHEVHSHYLVDADVKEGTVKESGNW